MRTEFTEEENLLIKEGFTHSQDFENKSYWNKNVVYGQDKEGNDYYVAVEVTFYPEYKTMWVSTCWDCFYTLLWL